MPKAIRVRDDNIPMIVEYAKELGFDLRHLKDNLEYSDSYDEDLYLITDGTQENNNITFTEFSGTYFRSIWKFTQHENPNKFVPIERV